MQGVRPGERRWHALLRSLRRAGGAPGKPVVGAGPAREQRRLLTALFVDISGFTSLSEQVDPETLSEIIDTVITRLGDVR